MSVRTLLGQTLSNCKRETETWLLLCQDAMKASKCLTVQKKHRQETSMVQVRWKQLERDGTFGTKSSSVWQDLICFDKTKFRLVWTNEQMQWRSVFQIENQVREMTSSFRKDGVWEEPFWWEYGHTQKGHNITLPSHCILRSSLGPTANHVAMLVAKTKLRLVASPLTSPVGARRLWIIERGHKWWMRKWIIARERERGQRAAAHECLIDLVIGWLLDCHLLIRWVNWANLIEHTWSKSQHEWLPWGEREREGER